ncbi:MAG: glycosyltransferase [Saprospiraceae bacterium]|nr:glycosyltransferase [Saprospiraceae bacterium]
MSQSEKPKMVLCMTSDFAFDQRMQRIAKSLAGKFEVTVIHRPSGKLNTFWGSANEIRISCLFNNGPLFYAEFNLRLFFLLLFRRFDVLYSVDTDTLTAVGLAKIFTRRKAVYDSHEWFTEVPELIGRPRIKAIWNGIERSFISGMDLCITVNESLASQFGINFKKPFLAIRNLPHRDISEVNQDLPAKILIYQGAVNKGRGIECAIEALKYLPDFDLHIYGNGDLRQDLEDFVKQLEWGNRIKFFGAVSPEALKTYTRSAMFGLNLLDGSSLSYRYSLANKFFDYLQAGIPSVNMDFPEYRSIVEEYPVGVLLSGLEPQNLARLIISHTPVYEKLKNDCIKYRNLYVWEEEELKLLEGLGSLLEGNKG